MRLSVRAAIIGAASLALVGGVGALPAYASPWSHVHGGQARFNGGWVDVCDTLVDGNRVRAHLRHYDGSISLTGWAPSSAHGSGCTSEGGHPQPYIRACAENHGCGPWVYRY